jgi:hypothetical protein
MHPSLPNYITWFLHHHASVHMISAGQADVVCWRDSHTVDNCSSTSGCAGWFSQRTSQLLFLHYAIHPQKISYSSRLQFHTLLHVQQARLQTRKTVLTLLIANNSRQDRHLLPYVARG